MTPAEVSYAKMLGLLEKDAFQDEVCARLGAIFADLQRIPPKPHGDAGLDGVCRTGKLARIAAMVPNRTVKKNVKA